MIYILGINGFIAKDFYLNLRKTGQSVTCLSHTDIDNFDKVHTISEDDIVINFCGVNKSISYDEFYQGNVQFLKDIFAKLERFDKFPYFIHVSSLMVCGFVGKEINDLPEYQKYFINTKLEGERFLNENYPSDKLCIIRPSNIYGYHCEPYYNNLLVTLVHEKINKIYKTNNINKNCVRNFLSIEGLCAEINKIIYEKCTGTYNIVSNNTISLAIILELLYDKKLVNILISNGDSSISIIEDANAKTIVVNENLEHKIVELESQIVQYLDLQQFSKINKLNRLSQPRGDMVEISDLESGRLYMITLNDHSVRGNHYHYEQIEDFFVSKGQVFFLLAHKNNPNINILQKMEKDMIIRVYPYYIHTLINDFLLNDCEIFITSTQPYISGCVPDTTYVDLI